MMLTLANPGDFDVDSVISRWFLPQVHSVFPIEQAPSWLWMYPQLKISPILFSCVLLYLFQIKSFLFLFFDLVVSFGSTHTKRRTQFQVTNDTQSQTEDFIIWATKYSLRAKPWFSWVKFLVFEHNTCEFPYSISCFLFITTKYDE